MVAVGLNATQVFRHLRFKERLRFTEEMVEQDIFGRDRRVGFEFVEPMTVFALLGAQKICCRFNLAIEACVEGLGRHDTA